MVYPARPRPRLNNELSTNPIVVVVVVVVVFAEAMQCWVRENPKYYDNVDYDNDNDNDHDNGAEAFSNGLI